MGLSRAHRAPACAAAALAWGFGAAPALAQQSAPATPATATPAAAPPPTSVTVVAPTSGYRSTIDRQSYSLATDLQKETGSLADVLAHVPAVQVDVDGVVSLRGDPDVTILVDGQPSALFSGPGRAQALQSMSADQFERVEVMTNPPAGVTAAGSGGVINLITKRAPKAGAKPSFNGTVKADLGTGDRFDLGAGGTYTAWGLSLTGGADFRRGFLNRDIGSHYGLPDPATGALTPATGVVDQDEREGDLTVHGGVGYDLGPHDHMDAGLNAVSGRLVRSQDSAYQTGAATGPLALDYAGPGYFDGHFTSVAETLGLTHTLPGDGQSVSVKLAVSQSNLTLRYGEDYAYGAPVQPNLFQDQVETAAFPQLDLKVDYKTPLPNKATLALGYEVTFDWQTEANRGVQGGSAALAVAEPAFAQSFSFDQQVQALYATYQQAFGKLTVQPGLRLEETTIDTDRSVPTVAKGRQAYFEAFPSLHLDYALDDTSQLKASYGRRATRPDESQLDPFHIELTTTAYSTGNPQLRPAITQSFEVGYAYRQKSTDYQATLFYRDHSDLLTQVAQDTGDNVLLNTWENIGHGQDTGLELVANRDLFKGFSVNASTDIMRSEIDAGNLGIAGVRAATVVSGRATLNWQVTPQDFIQLGGGNSGRQLTAQGYHGGGYFSDFGWRHRFDQRLAAVLTARNPFGLVRRTWVIDTPELVEVDRRKTDLVAVFLGLTYAFGAAPKRADNFDFGPSGQGAQ